MRLSSLIHTLSDHISSNVRLLTSLIHHHIGIILAGKGEWIGEYKKTQQKLAQGTPDP
jgi:hypothetical protein